MDVGEEEDTGAPPQPRPASVVKLSLFVIRAMARHRTLLALCILASLGVAFATGLFASLVPVLVQVITGREGSLGKSPLTAIFLPFFRGLSQVGQFQALAVALVAVAALRALFSYAEGRLSQYMTVLVERDLRQRVFDEIIESDQSFLAKERVANLYAMMHTYPRQSAMIADQFLATFTKALSFAAIIVSLLFVSWQLTLIAAAMGITAFLLVTRMRVAIRRMGRDINVERVKLNQVSMEALHSMKLIRFFGREQHTRASFLDTVRRLQKQSFKRASLQALAPQVQRLVGMVLFATLLVAATLILPGRDPDWVLTLTAFILIVNQLNTPMGSVARQQTKILGELPALEELMAFLEAPKPKMRDGTRAFDRLRDGVRFDRVSFAYSADGATVLRDVSFEVPRGRMVALVGASGSGKSTAVQLVARLADPTQGRILVDGVDLRELRIGTWRRRLAIVSQETFLFNTTVRENIRFGRLEATDAEVEAAARAAEAHAFITELEQGYETVLGDRGARLSGGQAQRIAIARALLADPDLLILDEATSALDGATERAVQQAVDRATRGRTVLAVAHRLSTVRSADLILVLEAGRIVERGTHDELMAMGGRYAEYVRLQDLSEDAELPRRAPPPELVAEEPAPAQIARLVIGPDGRGAAAVDASGRTHAVRVVALNGHGAPDGDVAQLEPGAPFARVVVGGRAHEHVPIFQRRADGAEVRSRVVRVGEAEKGLKGLAQRMFG